MEGIEELGPDFEENYRKLVEAMEDRCRQIGLYLEAASVTESTPDMRFGGEGKLVVLASFTIGEVAFMKRTQDPDAAVIDHTVLEMDDDMKTQAVEQMRQQANDHRTHVEPVEGCPLCKLGSDHGDR